MQDRLTITDALAVARITRLVVEDEISEDVRKELTERLTESGHEKLAYLISCPYCVSVWAGLAVAFGLVPKKVRLALALSEAMVTLRSAVDALPSRW